MRHKLLFGTKLRFYLTEIPLIYLFLITKKYNAQSDGLLRLYPLMVVTVGAMLFILLYYLRGVILYADEIRDLGLFSERNRVLCEEGQTLTLTLLPRRKIRVELYGENREGEGLSLLGERDRPKVINLYRGRALGSVRTVRSILTFYGVPTEAADALVRDGKGYEDTCVRAESTVENERRVFRLTFLHFD